ncbi:MAG: hypothetical protein IJ246_02920 [Clostridia bacterium]|nr:hypothetical protein [Clostridia bacterium]
MKRFLCLILVLILGMSVASEAGAVYFSEIAITIEDTEITSEELESAMNQHLIISALYAASAGHDTNITDGLTIIDVLTKVTFDLEQRQVIRNQAALYGIDQLTIEETVRARVQASKKYQAYLDMLFSENAFYFLPAGNYEYVDDDTQGNAKRYLESFGLTEDALYLEEIDWILDEKLKNVILSQVQDTDISEDYYIDWFMDAYYDTYIYEDAVAIAEVCLKLAGKYEGI